MIVGCAIYRDGVRVATPHDLEELGEACRANGGIAWIGLLRADRGGVRVRRRRVRPARARGRGRDPGPPAAQARALRRDALRRPPRRPATSTRPRRSSSPSCTSSSAPTSSSPSATATPPISAGSRRRMEADRTSSSAAQRRSSTRSSTGWSTTTPRSSPASRTTSTRSRTRSSAATPHVSRRTYELSREVIEFQRAIDPARSDARRAHRRARQVRVDEERRYLRDVQDHAIQVQEQVDGFRELLQNILSVNLPSSAQQNEEVKPHRGRDRPERRGEEDLRLGGDPLRPDPDRHDLRHELHHMPELHWRLGYPLALVLMLGTSVVLYVIFKRRRLDLSSRSTSSSHFLVDGEHPAAQRRDQPQTALAVGQVGRPLRPRRSPGAPSGAAGSACAPATRRRRGAGAAGPRPR